MPVRLDHSSVVVAKYNAVDMMVNSVSLIEDKVAVAAVEELFIFLFFCSFNTWSCVCGLQMVKWIGSVPLRCRHGRMIYLAQHVNLFRVKQCFHTTEFALPFFPTKGCTSAIFHCLRLHVFSKHALAIRTGVAKSVNFRVGAGQSGVHRWRLKGLLHIPHGVQ